MQNPSHEGEESFFFLKLHLNRQFMNSDEQAQLFSDLGVVQLSLKRFTHGVFTMGELVVFIEHGPGC